MIYKHKLNISSGFDIVHMEHAKQQQSNEVAYLHEDPHEEEDDQYDVFKVIEDHDHQLNNRHDSHLDGAEQGEVQGEGEDSCSF